MRDNNAEDNPGIGTNIESENISHSNFLPRFAVKWMGKEMRPEEDGVTTTSTAATRSPALDNAKIFHAGDTLSKL